MVRSIGKKGRNNRKQRSEETAEERELRLDRVKSKMKKESEEKRKLQLNTNRYYMQQFCASQIYSQTGNHSSSVNQEHMKFQRKLKSKLQKDALRYAS